MKKSILVLLAFGLAIVLNAVLVLAQEASNKSTIKKDFAETQDKNTVEAYEDFLKKYPDSEYSTILTEYITERQNFDKYCKQFFRSQVEISEKIENKHWEFDQNIKYILLTKFAVNKDGYIVNGEEMIIRVKREYLKSIPVALSLGEAIIFISREIKKEGFESAEVIRIPFGGKMEDSKAFLEDISRLPRVEMLEKETPPSVKRPK